MIKIKDVTRLNAFGYTHEKPTGFKTGFYNKEFANYDAGEYSHIFVNEKTGVVSIDGDAMNELLDEVFELKSAGLLVRVSDDEKG